jgi:PKD repeat protein
VRTALLATARDAGPAGYDYAWGHGWPDGVAFAKQLGAGPAVRPVPPGSALPRDANADWRYEDVNGNGRPDFADVVLYFNQMGWIAAYEPVIAFDFNANGRIDFADVVWLFNRL